MQILKKFPFIVKQHKIWYRRELFKNHFKSYKNWDNFNPPSGIKHPYRYKNDAVQCQNSNCERESMLISEHEAFYYFAKKSVFKRIKIKVVNYIRFKKDKTNRRIYVCPFCKGDDIREI